MNANKTIRLLKKLLLSAAALLAFSACENFGDPGAYFDSYGSVAKITSVTYSRQPVEKDGSYYIDSDDDFTITYLIDNPGNFAFANFFSSSSYTIELTKTYIKYSYPKNYLAQIDGDTAGLNSTVSLIALAPNGKMIQQEYYQGPKILCNSPPPKIENAVAQMYSDTSASINERLVIPVQIPTPASYYTYEHDGQTYKSYKYDYASLVVTDTRSGTVHEFPFQSYSSYIPTGTESNGWTVDLSVYSIGPTCPGGPTFTYDMSKGGATCYIYTDVYDLTSIEPFPIKFFIRDKLGLEGEELEIPSRAVKLAAPTCSDSTGSLTNSLSAPYAEFTIYAPSNGPDATLHYTITDSSGNPVADTSGSASEHVGDATFNLYPKADGSAETYTISQAYATKTGCVDSDDAAATFGSAGTISVTGVQLESPVADIADGASIPQETKLTLESPQGGDIWWITSDAGASGDDPSPVEIIIDASGSYIVQAYAHKAYYQNSTIAKWTYNVFMSKVYIKSDGNDFGGTGTIGQPFQSFTRAKTAFATSGDPTNPANKIYVLDDMPSMNGLTSIDAGYYNVIGCNGGVAGAPVSLGVVGGGSIFSVNGGTLTLRSISITGQDHASSGAVDFIAGTFILKDKVTITGNAVSPGGAAKNVNIASGQKITIDAGGLGGTKVGVTSADVPASGTSITITDGYKDACGTEPLGGHFVSDVPGYAFIFDAAGEAALATGGGSIDVGDIYSVAFAKTASAGVYTFTASATPTSGASPVDITDECTWLMELYELNTYSGMTSATNTMDLSALGEGTYIMKIKATYGGKVYSGEVEIVKGPVGLGTPLTLEAAVAGAVVTFDNKATGPVTYTVNGGTGGTIASGAAGTITLAAVGDKVQFYGDNAAYATDTTDGNCSNIACNKNCYVYGNIMSLIKSAGFESQKTLTGSYTFCKLFKDNAYIKNKTGADLLLPATTLKYCCYKAMFQNCASLTTVPELPATSVTEQGYYSMFQGCTSLTTAPNLPATSLAMASCCRMFQDCTSLTSAPALPAITMESNCYESMFQGCTSLASAPELPATTLEYACYAHMFEGCTSLTSAPELPATTLESKCYKEMFSGCTSLTSAPALPATGLPTYCYYGMFKDCSSLNSVTCLATDINATGCVTNWLNGVASSGALYKASGMADWTSGADGIPSGWTIQNAP